MRSKTGLRKDPIAAPSKETPMTLRRTPIATVILVAVLAFFAVGASAASAAPSPWWQVLDGSRPSILWKGTDSVQEIETEKVEIAGEEVFAGAVKVNGKAIGCMGAGGTFGFSAAFICEAFVGFPLTETAAQLEELLETPYGAEVEVIGGPVGTAPFTVTVPGRSVPPVQVVPLDPPESPFPPFGVSSTKLISAGGSGRLNVTITNLGDRAIDGSNDPVRVLDELPEGVSATGVEVLAGNRKHRVPVDCELETEVKVACLMEGQLPIHESIQLEVFVVVDEPSLSAGAPGRITVSGGGAPSISEPQQIEIGPGPVPFGAERFSARAEEEGGGETRNAGRHPFQLTTTIQLNAAQLTPGGSQDESDVAQPALPRNLHFTLPPGLIGNTTAVPRCSTDDYWNSNGDASHSPLRNHCPDNTSIGLATVTVIERGSLKFNRFTVPLFNLAPRTGEPARLGFTVAGAPILIETRVDTDHGYRILADVENTTQIAKFLSSTVTIWGTPGDPRHDIARGWACAQHESPEEFGGCQNPPGASEVPFLRMPVNCNTPLGNAVELEPWNVPLGSVIDSRSYETPPLQACNQVPLNPQITATPTTKLASNPSGFAFGLQMPNSGLLSSEATAEGQAKKVEVTLPEGMTINPSQGEGLVGCSPAQYASERFDSAPGAGCPNASKVGEVKVSTPLLDEEARGSLYVASPYENPFDSLIALYMIARIPERGILVRQAGVVEPDPKTGQLTTTFDNLPQLPFSRFELNFRPGARAPLVTPPSCDGDPSVPGNQPFTLTARFTPWSATDPDNPQPSELVTKTSSFTVERGADGGPSSPAPPTMPPAPLAPSPSSSPAPTPNRSSPTSRSSCRRVSPASSPGSPSARMRRSPVQPRAPAPTAAPKRSMTPPARPKARWGGPSPAQASARSSPTPPARSTSPAPTTERRSRWSRSPPVSSGPSTSAPSSSDWRSRSTPKPVKSSSTRPARTRSPTSSRASSCTCATFAPSPTAPSSPSTRQAVNQLRPRLPCSARASISSRRPMTTRSSPPAASRPRTAPPCPSSPSSP
jgi:hypothetical protein